MSALRILVVAVRFQATCDPLSHSSELCNIRLCELHRFWPDHGHGPDDLIMPGCRDTHDWPHPICAFTAQVLCGERALQPVIDDHGPSIAKDPSCNPGEKLERWMDCRRCRTSTSMRKGSARKLATAFVRQPDKAQSGGEEAESLLDQRQY